MFRMETVNASRKSLENTGREYCLLTSHSLAFLLEQQFARSMHFIPAAILESTGSKVYHQAALDTELLTSLSLPLLLTLQHCLFSALDGPQAKAWLRIKIIYKDLSESQTHTDIRC